MKKSKHNKGSYKLNSVETTKDFANKQEKIIAKKIGGKLTVNSGALRFMPGDIYLGKNLIDVKSAKTSKQIIITESMLNKLETDAALKSKNPVLLLNFPNSKELQNKEWIMFPIRSKKL